MLYNLQYVLGDSLFKQSMRHYVSKWKIAHPYFEDFRQSIIEYTHQDLNWFFDQWMETTKTTDYGIKSIKRTEINNQYKIKFKRYGQMQMPIDFAITAKNGTVTNYHIPNNYFVKNTHAKVLKKWYGWDLLYPTYTAKVDVPSGIKVVQIDPSNRLADVDMMDNYKRPGQMLAQESLHLKYESYVNNTPTWKKYNAFMRPDIWYNSVDGIKLGIHFDGAYMNYLRKLYATVWVNTRLAANTKYTAFEGQSWWYGVSPIDYTVRYETPLKTINQKMNIGVQSRYMDGMARHSIYTSYDITPQSNIKLEATTLYRNGLYAHYYPLFQNEWSSYLHAGTRTSQQNAYMQLQWNNTYSYKRGYGKNNITIRAPFTYQYAYIQGEQVNHWFIKKLDIKTRLFARFGTGNNIPTESALYLQGANPEDMMENKFDRSQGIVPASMGGYATDNFSNWQSGGGLNLRGYNGYYAIDQDTTNGPQYINYKGRSGAAVNVEIDVDQYITFKPNTLRDYLHLDVYLFGDAGIISRGKLNNQNIPELTPVKQWSKIRMDAGIGTAWTIKKFGPFEKVPPFTIRFDMPLFLSAPPFAKPDFVSFRWILGVSRAF
jgi:aminopeptidase N